MNAHHAGISLRLLTLAALVAACGGSPGVGSSGGGSAASGGGSAASGGGSSASGGGSAASGGGSSASGGGSAASGGGSAASGGGSSASGGGSAASGGGSAASGGGSAASGGGSAASGGGSASSRGGSAASGGGSASSGGGSAASGGGSASSGGGSASSGGGSASSGGGSASSGGGSATSDGGLTDGGLGDAGLTDAGTDAGLPMGCVGAADNTPCGTNGLCKGQVCSPCVDPADDTACATAYGAPRLCVSGACVAADCRTDVNCATGGHPGWICGLSQQNVCAPCTTDSHCTNAPGYGAATMCAVAGGTCILSACGNAATTQTTTTVNTACSAANSADFCCVRANGTTCAAGNCCTDTQCQAPGGPGGVCRSNVCTTCTAVTNNQYFVDPINGSDTNSTGSAVCPFRSIGRAIQFINAMGAVPSGTQITLVNDSLNSNATRGELFPLTVPGNVTITGANAGGPRTIEIPSGKSGFNLTSANSGLTTLIIDGKNVGVTGVSVGGASSNTTTTLSTVTVRNMGSDGVLVTAGGLRINAGCLFTANGQNFGSSGQGAGLRVTGGNVTANITAGQARVGFDANLGNGVLVSTSGSVTFTGVPDLTGYPANQNPPAVAAGSGTLTANGNTLANVAVAQSGATRPISLLNGVVAWGGKGNGFNFSSGSAVNLRNSVAAKNEQSGVRITASFSGAITGPGAGPTINLGPDSLGKNVLQTPTNGNKAAGICIDGNFLNAAQSLSAKANYFSGKDCSAAASMPLLTVNSSLDGCANGLDVGLERTTTNQQQTNIRVLLANCQDL